MQGNVRGRRGRQRAPTNGCGARRHGRALGDGVGHATRSRAIGVIGAIGLEARGAVRITSSTADIRIAAPKRIVVNGGGSFSEWSNEGIVHGTPGRWVEHAASHVKTGPVGPPF
ncbi:DUF2345 domain-containing protein [Variovorax sp. CT11-76]